jgi:hypothetical protein
MVGILRPGHLMFSLEAAYRIECLFALRRVRQVRAEKQRFVTVDRDEFSPGGGVGRLRSLIAKGVSSHQLGEADS